MGQMPARLGGSRAAAGVTREGGQAVDLGCLPLAKPG